MGGLANQSKFLRQNLCLTLGGTRIHNLRIHAEYYVI